MQKVPELVFLCVGQSWVKDWEDQKSLQAFTAYEQAYSTITGRTLQHCRLSLQRPGTGNTTFPRSVGESGEKL
jgi:hypothetical protein